MLDGSLGVNFRVTEPSSLLGLFCPATLGSDWAPLHSPGRPPLSPSVPPTPRHRSEVLSSIHAACAPCGSSWQVPPESWSRLGLEWVGLAFLLGRVGTSWVPGEASVRAGGGLCFPKGVGKTGLPPGSPHESLAPFQLTWSGWTGLRSHQQ